MKRLTVLLSALAMGFAQTGCMGSDLALVGAAVHNFQFLDGENGLNGANGLNGQPGADGQDGQDGTFNGEVLVIDPCGDDPNHLDEILVLIDGTYFATIDSSYLVRLEPGNYVTEDPQRCGFQITNDGRYVEN